MVGQIAADARVGADDEDRGTVEVVQIAQGEPQFEHADGGVNRIVETDTGDTRHVRSGRALGQEIVAQTAFDIDRLRIAEPRVERIAAERAGHPFGPLILS